MVEHFPDANFAIKSYGLAIWVAEHLDFQDCSKGMKKRFVEMFFEFVRIVYRRRSWPFAGFQCQR